MSKPYTMERKLRAIIADLSPCPERWPHNSFMHTAILLKGKKVVETATNRVGSRKMGAGYSDRMIHAEKALVKKVGDVRKLEGLTMCVWRVSTKSLMPSKPCPDCEQFLKKCMREYGLKAVYYTDTVIPFDHATGTEVEPEPEPKRTVPQNYRYYEGEERRVSRVKGSTSKSTSR